MEQLWFFFITVFFVDRLDICRDHRTFILLFLLFLFICFNKPHFCCDCEMCNRAMNHSLVKFILEQILLDWDSLLKIWYCHLAHMHNCPNIKLIYPMCDLVHSQNRSFARIIAAWWYKFFFHLLLVVLWIFLPVVKWWLIYV